LVLTDVLANTRVMYLSFLTLFIREISGDLYVLL